MNKFNDVSYYYYNNCKSKYNFKMNGKYLGKYFKEISKKNFKFSNILRKIFHIDRVTIPDTVIFK